MPPRWTGGRKIHRPRYTGPSPEVRLAVLERDGACLVGGCWKGPFQHHHRCPRRAGGTLDPAINSPANLVTVCLEHHAWIESNRNEAKAAGWLLSTPDAAPVVPVKSYRGWILLSSDGRATAVDEP